MRDISRRSLLASVGLAGTLATAPGTAAHRAGFKVVGLRTAMRIDPLGIDDRSPSLSWQMVDDHGRSQSAYQILVATSLDRLDETRADLWNSGRLPSQANSIPYSGKGVSSRQRCYWKVRLWSQDGTVSAWSEAGAWEVGLLDDVDWAGDWLSMESPEERDDRKADVHWVTSHRTSVGGPAAFRLRFHCGEGSALLTILAKGELTDLAIDDRPLALPFRDPNGYGPPPAARFDLALGRGGHVLTASVAAQGKSAAVQRVALAAQVRLPGGARVTAGWEMRSTPGSAWVQAEPASPQPDFPWPPTPARLLRRQFTLEGAPASARIYVAALGGYCLWINGARVGNDELQSERADYRRHIPYRTYDVTSLLRAGDNVVGAIVGDGFYASYQGPDGRFAFGPAPRRIRLMVETVDARGQLSRIVTDPNWRHTGSPVLMSEIYNGEDHDCRLWPRGWSAPGFDDRAWDQAWAAPSPAGRLIAPTAEPVRAIRTLGPTSIRAVEPSRHVVDFGQNFAGRVRLTVTGKSGDRVIIRHAEILDAQGRLDRRNLRPARAEDRYVLSGDREVLEPIFTYQGFRYVEIEGVANLVAGQIEGVVLSSDLGETGLFRIDNPLIQKLWLNTLWSQRSNFMGVPTDCPQRDERLGWTGDAQVFWDTAAFNMAIGGFTRTFTQVLRDDQAANGAYPMWAPSPNGLGWGTTSATPGWSDAGIMLPYVGYLHTGDSIIVDENWQAMTAYVEGILRTNPDGVWNQDRGADLGDWLALDAVKPGDETTPRALIATAMLARSIDQLATMAGWTKRSEEHRRWQSEATKVRRAFVRAFVRADGMVGNGSQTGSILALRLDLLPPRSRKAVGERLVADIRRRGTLLSTGFLGTPLALDALADIGEAKLAYDLLLRTDYPSWGYMARQGATTIWERWNGDTGDVVMNSFNHYALGAVCGFLYRRVAGIEPIAPGFATFRVAPLLDERINSAGASLDSVQGRIEVNWERGATATEFKIRVPANSRAHFVAGGTPRILTPGEHIFRLAHVGRSACEDRCKQERT